MQVKKIFENDDRIEKIYNLLIRYTTSDYSAREQVSDKGDELDAIILGLNTLGEELQTSGRTLKRFEQRVTMLMDMLLKYTLMDFSEKVVISDAGDELDAIAVGLNTLVEELRSSQEEAITHNKNLEEKNTEIGRLNTSLKQNIQQLEVANKELEAFTYSVSHDLRAPLRAIHSYTKIISQDYGDKIDQEGKEMMNAVMRNAKKMGQLIDDLLAFSKVGKKELRLAEIDMTALAAAVVKELHSLMPNQKAQIVIHPMPPAVADYNLMHLVYINLISNAIKYSSAKAGPRVEIGSEEVDKRVVYYVKDNGAGFDMLYYDKLFGVFQRLHSSDEFEGTGVGLALVKRIIARHGGSIRAEGKLNEGATFYFSLTI